MSVEQIARYFLVEPSDVQDLLEASGMARPMDRAP